MLSVRLSEVWPGVVVLAVSMWLLVALLVAAVLG